ncbi:segregation and condensation protein A [Veillonella criceti]|uniref:Segregation and condensation protein A n=1 Tax=Veillonella criceti TaxID=103891 RepID=A0A380NGM3_9FIRM|nr:segregation/condensation protein A [Veillonella criceti]SUP40613.1 Segregation and condensation protein A [Veillonella criceti]
MQSYEYKLAVFEGPLDLLLHLIEKHKIDIYDIPIVEITSQYMAQLELWQTFDIQYSSEFLVMAATLLQIKSRMLLPRTAPLNPEEAEDPRDELVANLLEYKQIKELTDALTAKTEMSSQSFSRPDALSQWGQESVFRFDIAQLYSIFKTCYERSQEIVPEPPKVKVEKEAYSLEEMIDSLLLRAKQKRRFSFVALLNEVTVKAAKVTMFIAVLELLKRQTFSITAPIVEGNDGSLQDVTLISEII